MGEVSSGWLVCDDGVELIKLDVPERFAILAESIEQIVCVAVAEIHGPRAIGSRRHSHHYVFRFMVSPEAHFEVEKLGFFDYGNCRFLLAKYLCKGRPAPRADSCLETAVKVPEILIIEYADDEPVGPGKCAKGGELLDGHNSRFHCRGSLAA